MQEINTTEQTAEVTPVTVEETLREQTLQSDIQTDNGETAVSYGKFKSADSLYEGYQQLEKEFTKKCQVLKELENQLGDNHKIFEKMLNVNPELEQFADELKTAGSVEELGLKLAQLLAGKINEPCKIINDENFLNNYVYTNADIINKVVADYLDSLVSIKVPQTITKGGNSYVSPTYRPRTLDEAGKMAKKFIETRRF